MLSTGARDERAEREDVQVHVEGQVGTRDFCYLKCPTGSGHQRRALMGLAGVVITALFGLGPSTRWVCRRRLGRLRAPATAHIRTVEQARHKSGKARVAKATRRRGLEPAAKLQFAPGQLYLARHC